MYTIWTTLYPNLDDLSKGANIALSFLTLGLVWLTKVLASETRATRLQNISPEIIVTIEPHQEFGFFKFVVENIGSGAAFDVTIKLDPDICIPNSIFLQPDINLSTFSLTKIPTLKPHQKIEAPLGHWKAFTVKATKFSVECRDSRGQIVRHQNAIDLSIYESLCMLKNTETETIARGVDQISNLLDRVTHRGSRLAVDIFDRKDREGNKDP